MEPHEPLTAALLREFVLTIDLKLEQFRTEMQTEFGQLRADMREGFARLETPRTALDHRLDRVENRLDRLEGRLLYTALTAGIALASSLVALWR